MRHCVHAGLAATQSLFPRLCLDLERPEPKHPHAAARRFRPVLWAIADAINIERYRI
jgi:hypothetical protein